MFFRAITGGFKAAARRPGLVLLLWAWHTVLALVVTLPAWAGIRTASEMLPETDVLLRGVQLGTLIELLQRDAGVVPMLLATVAALVGVSLLSNAFLAGGMLEVLLAGDDRRLLHRFFRGAGHFFFRSLALLAIAALFVVVVGGLAAAALSAALRPLAAGGSEAGGFLSGVLTLGVLALVAGVFMLALDYARVVLVIGDRRGAVRTWFRALRFVLVHPVATGAIGILFAILVLTTLWLAAWLPLQLGATEWRAILTAVAVQQLLILARIGVRVSQIAAQAHLYELATPTPVPEPAAAPELNQGSAVEAGA
ncbi:MAG: hypothetical protein EHM24_04905 [Acidobacteria bacterium]|nr:MAG: hypothetical protein EHM24_04905 [Acidobacteriota bacterium]